MATSSPGLTTIYGERLDDLTLVLAVLALIQTETTTTDIADQERLTAFALKLIVGLIHGLRLKLPTSEISLSQTQID